MIKDYSLKYHAYLNSVKLKTMTPIQKATSTKFEGITSPTNLQIDSDELKAISMNAGFSYPFAATVAATQKKEIKYLSHTEAPGCIPNLSCLPYESA